MPRSDGAASGGLARVAGRALPVVLVGLCLAASACAPSCERTCRKILKCGNLESDRIAVEECQASCQTQIGMFDGWADEKELDRAFDDHRRCLVRSTCEEIEAGECYDDRLFPLGDESPLATGGTTGTSGSTGSTGSSSPGTGGSG